MRVPSFLTYTRHCWTLLLALSPAWLLIPPEPLFSFECCEHTIRPGWISKWHCIADLVCGMLLSGPWCTELNFYSGLALQSPLWCPAEQQFKGRKTHGGLGYLPNCKQQRILPPIPIGAIFVYKLTEHELQSFYSHAWQASVCGWYKLVRIDLMPNNPYSSHSVHDINKVPWSVRISFRIPTEQMTWNSARATLFVEIARSVVHED